MPPVLDMRFDVRRRQAQCGAKLATREVPLVLVHIREAHCDVRLGQRGIEADRALCQCRQLQLNLLCRRQLKVWVEREGHAQPGIRPGVRRIEPDRLPERLGTLLHALPAPAQESCPSTYKRYASAFVVRSLGANAGATPNAPG